MCPYSERESSNPRMPELISRALSSLGIVGVINATCLSKGDWVFGSGSLSASTKDRCSSEGLNGYGLNAATSVSDGGRTDVSVLCTVGGGIVKSGLGDTSTLGTKLTCSVGVSPALAVYSKGGV